MPKERFRRGCAAVFSARFAGRKNVRLPFSCARKCPKASAFPTFFSTWWGGGKKNGNGEILFVSRKERGYGKREYMASYYSDLPKRISEMKQNISDKIFRKSYGKNIQKHNKE